MFDTSTLAGTSLARCLLSLPACLPAWLPGRLSPRSRSDRQQYFNNVYWEHNLLAIIIVCVNPFEHLNKTLVLLLAIELSNHARGLVELHSRTGETNFKRTHLFKGRGVASDIAHTTAPGKLILEVVNQIIC